MAAPTGILAALATPAKKSPGSEGPGADSDPVAGSLRAMFDSLKAGRDNEAASAFREAYSHCDGGMEGDEMEEEKEPDLDDL